MFDKAAPGEAAYRGDAALLRRLVKISIGQCRRCPIIESSDDDSRFFRDAEKSFIQGHMGRGTARLAVSPEMDRVGGQSDGERNFGKENTANKIGK